MKRNRPLNQEKREAIINASIKEFYTKGFEGSSMDTIAKEAKVSKATVYNHFKNKEELFFVLAAILQNRFRETFTYEYNEGKEIEVQLYEIAKKDMNFLSSEENIKLIQIVTIVMIQKNDIGKKLTKEFNDNYLLMTSKWFEKAKEKEKLVFEDGSFVAKQFIGMIKAFAFMPQLYGAPALSKEEEEKVISKAIEMIKVMYSK